MTLFLGNGDRKKFTNNGRTGRVGVIEKYTIPSTGSYRIKAGGARGGKHVTNYGSYPGKSHYLN